MRKLCLLLLCSIVLFKANSQAGSLDSSFGNNGIQTTAFISKANIIFTSTVIQGNKIVAAGSSNRASNGNFALARYTADGTLDSTFGVNGLVTTDFDNNSNDQANAVALQGNKIIAVGNSDIGSALARYTADGTLDSTFGDDGKVITHLDGISRLNEIVLHQNRLYAVGSVTTAPGNTYGAVAAYQLEAPEPTINITIADVTVPESKKFAVVTVSLSAPANKWVRVNYTTRENTAMYPQDYLHIKGTLLFKPGTTKAKVYIPIVNNSQDENNEQFELHLTKAWNATIRDSVAVVTILDDDGALITKQATSLHINVSPNPSADGFTIRLQGSNYRQPVSVRVYDVSGRLLEERKNISIGQSLRLGGQYKAGTYIIVALQGSRRMQTKVIKTGK